MSAAEEKQRVWRALWRAKMHLEPHVWSLVPPSVQAAYEHPWQPAERLFDLVRPWPLGLLRAWQDSRRGHVIFGRLPSQYRPGPLPWREETLEGVCHISLQELLQEETRVLLALFQMMDHLLGSDGAPDGPWLSDGAGITPALAAVGAQVAQSYALGYWQGALEVRDAHDYFAHTLWLHLHDPRRLNVLDPLLHKLYRRTLMNDTFWPQARPDAPARR